MHGNHMEASGSIGVIAVSYFNSSELKRLITSMQMQESRAWSLVIVDNSVDAEENRRIQSLRLLDSRIQISTQLENLGYMPAAIASLPLIEDATWTIICNSDVEFDKPDTFSRVLNTRSSEIAVIAPQVTDWFTGANLNPFLERRPTGLWVLLRLVGSSHILLYKMMILFHSWALKLRKVSNTRKKSHTRRVYAAHGSCFILEASFAQSLTKVRFQRLYGEELTVATYAQKTRRAVVYGPQLTAIHYSHASTGSLAVAQIRELQFSALKTYSRDRNSQGRDSV